MEISKFDFFVLLSKIDQTKGWGFKYDKTGNDPMTSRYWVKHTASYDFYLISNDGECHELVSKTHQRTHEEVENLLVKKFTHWVTQFKKGKTFTDVFLQTIKKKK